MTAVIINDILPLTQIIASGGQTLFSTDWTADVASDVVVYSRATGVAANDATQIVAYPAGYSVAFIGSGNIVQVTLVTPSTLGDIVTITRMTPADRLNLYSNTNFTPSMLNNDFGILTLVDQQAQLVNQQVGPRYNYSAIINQNAPTEDTILPILALNQVWQKNAGNTAIIGFTLGTAAGLAATNPALPYVASVNSPVVVGHVAVFSDTLGTLIDSGQVLTQGTVTSISTGTGLTGGPITTAGTISFAPIAPFSLWANITSGTAVPTVIPISGLIPLGAVLLNPTTDQNIIAHNLQVSAGELISGSSSGGFTGVIRLYPVTTANGQFIISATDNSSNLTMRLTNGLFGQNTVITIPDPVASTANVLLSKASGAQHITVGSLQVDAGVIISGLSTGGVAGNLTLYSPTASKGALTVAAADSSGNFEGTLTNGSLTAPRTWTLPDTSGTLALTTNGTVNAGSINQLAWYAANGTTVSGLATANNGVLVTSAGGVPSISSTLPAGLTITTPIINFPQILYIYDQTQNLPVLSTQSVAASVNFFEMTAEATGDSPQFQAVGTDTNITLTIRGKGNGGVLIQGLTNNIAIPAGYLGEEIFIQVPFASSVSLTTATAINVCSQVLTAGTYTASGNYFATPVTGFTAIGGWLSLVSATTPDQSLYIYDSGAAIGQIGRPVRTITFSTSGGTIYLSVNASFSSTATACGSITITRIG